MITIQELKERIIQNYDPDLVVEVLEISTEELLDRFEDYVVKYSEKFVDLFPEEEENEEKY